MKLRIDKLDNITDWIINSPSTIQPNEVDQYIAGYDNDASILISFNENDNIRTAVKVLSAPVDVTEYDTLILSGWSRSKQRGKYMKITDFSYKITINDTNSYYLPFFCSFSDINIGIEEITEINKIEIEALHFDNDVIIISEIIVEKEEPAKDLMLAIKEEIEYNINNTVGNGQLVMSGMTITAGDDKISFSSNPDYLERYSAIMIVEGALSEIHQIGDTTNFDFFFTTNYDGTVIINNYTNADIYLFCPVYLNPGQGEMYLPGVAIWELAPNPILRNSKIGTYYDSFSDAGLKSREGEQILEYNIQIDIENHSAGILELYATIVRNWISRMKLWVNGRKHNIDFSGPAQHIKPTQGIDLIEKISYTVKVEYNEMFYNRVDIGYTENININVDIK
jgi:hypothetical protein